MTSSDSDDATCDIEEQIASVEIGQLDNGSLSNRPDLLVCEEPIEIQVQGRSLSVLMRTPGHDEDLVSGFMITEEIVEKWDDIKSMAHCTMATDLDAVDNVMQVRLRSGLELDYSQFSRHFFGSSSCGVCGKAALEQVLKRLPILSDSCQLQASQFQSMMSVFTDSQAVFKKTGGLHGAALFSADGRHLITREDIGRHNAVDKVVGWAYRQGLYNLESTVLLVSGRISFEIVQKALVAQIPVIAAVSAPSSLAVELAKQSNQTILGFVRGDKLNIYSNAERILLD